MHTFEGIAQGVNLTRLHLRQFDVKTPFGRLVCYCDETHQQLHVLFDEMMAQQIDEHKADEEHGQDHIDQDLSIVIDNGCRYDDYDRPFRVFHIRIEYP